MNGPLDILRIASDRQHDADNRYQRVMWMQANRESAHALNEARLGCLLAAEDVQRAQQFALSVASDLAGTNA